MNKNVIYAALMFVVTMSSGNASSGFGNGAMGKRL